MAIAFDASSTGSAFSTTNLTFSHTCASNAVLLLALTSGTALSNPSVTYGGTAMTLIGSSDAGSSTTRLYGLKTPSSGANNISITFGVNTTMIGAAASYTGADRGINFYSSNTNTGNAASLSVSITTNTNNALQVASGAAPVDLLAETNTTQRAKLNDFGRTAIFVQKNAVTSPAGSTTVQIGTGGSATDIAMVTTFIVPDGYSTISVAETVSQTEAYSYQKTKNITVDEDMTLTEVYDIESPFTVWENEDLPNTTWTNEAL